MFHFGYPPIMRSMFENSGRELVEIFRRAKATGVTTSLDMSLPDANSPSGRADWRAILTATLPYVDVFQPSGEEILFMLHREWLEQLRTAGGDILYQFTPSLLHEISDELLGLGCKVVVIKLGHRGIYLRTGGRAAIESMGRAQPSDPAAWADKELWAPAFKVDEVGATGSGDSSISGFLSALLRGLSAADTAIMATAVGACNVEAADALSGIRTWDETRSRIDAGWEKHELTIDQPAWEFDSRQQIWRRA